MNFIIKGARIADVKHAGRFVTPQGVWHIPREPNVSVPAERGRRAIGSDI
jgi:hypothetical protein